MRFRPYAVLPLFVLFAIPWSLHAPADDPAAIEYEQDESLQSLSFRLTLSAEAEQAIADLGL